MAMNRFRTIKDIDIAKEVALKAATELTIAFKDVVAEQGKNASDVVIAAAEKFYQWVIPPEELQDSAEDQNGGYEEMVRKEIHRLQKKLGMPLTDFQHDACPWGDWSEGGAVHLLQTLREKVKQNGGNGRGRKGLTESHKKNLRNNLQGGASGARRGNTHTKGLEALADEYGYVHQGWNPNSNILPISKTQYGYAVSLLKKLGTDPDPSFLNGLTCKEASRHIDNLKEQLAS
jgi:hypothetical protein